MKTVAFLSRTEKAEKIVKDFVTFLQIQFQCKEEETEKNWNEILRMQDHARGIFISTNQTLCHVPSERHVTTMTSCTDGASKLLLVSL